MRCIASLAMVPQNADKLVNDNVVKFISNIVKKYIDVAQISEQVWIEANISLHI